LFAIKTKTPKNIEIINFLFNDTDPSRIFAAGTLSKGAELAAFVREL
jgi:hypothetical protein